MSRLLRKIHLWLLPLVRNRDHLNRLLDSLMEVGDYRGSLRVANQMERLGIEKGFENQGFCYLELKRVSEAVAALERGAKLFPNNSRIWELLGTAYSYASDLESSISAYKSGLKCPNPDCGALYYNMAVALSNHSRDEEALSCIRMSLEIQEERGEYNHGYFLCKGLQIVTLTRLKHYSEAEQVYNRARTRWESLATYHDLVEVIIGYAKSLRIRSVSYDILIPVLREAASLEPGHPLLLSIVREILHDKGLGFSRCIFGILLNVHEPKILADQNYYISFDVIADSLNEAIEFIKFFISDYDPEKIYIEQNKVCHLETPERKGVVEVSGRVFYPSEPHSLLNSTTPPHL